MIDQIKNVSLEFSCPEKLDRKAEGKFYCDKCAHQLIDFRNKPIKELKSEISNSVKPVCGVFNTSQLGDHFIKYALSTVIVTSSFAVPTFGQVPIKVDSVSKGLETVNKDDEEQVIFGMIVETQAQPIGGYAKFFEALASRIKYPQGLDSKGKTFIEFSIDTLGQMGDFKIIKGFNDAADKEALRAITSMNYPFTAGRMRNKPVTTRLVIPVLFDPKSMQKSK
jgi:hypothetical protein